MFMSLPQTGQDLSDFLALFFLSKSSRTRHFLQYRAYIPQLTSKSRALQIQSPDTLSPEISREYTRKKPVTVSDSSLT